MAVELAANGATVVCVARSAEKLAETVAAIEAAGGKAEAISCDVKDGAKVDQLVESVVARWERLDILVNNAGITRRHVAEEFPVEDWDQVIEVNLTAVFDLCQMAGKVMLAAGSGKIINVASLLSFTGGLTVPAYAASKGGVAQLTKALANEWASKGINVNALAPGYMDTPLNTALIADPMRNRQVLERIPAGRWGKPEDLKGAVVFLASRASDYVHGAILVIDGGFLGR